MGPPLSLLCVAALVANGPRGLLLTRAWRSLANACALSPLFDEDGRREWRHCSVAEHSTASSLHASLKRREHRKTCVVQPRTVCAVLGKSRQNPRPSADCARNPQAEKKAKIRS
jgi:hypothetical protein